LLSRLVKGRIVQAEAVSRDRYGRYVSILTVDGADVGLAMIGSGLAWAYRDYLKDLPDGYAEAYEQAENEARRSGRGLWGAPYPMEPWKWRRVYRQMQERSRSAGKGSRFSE
jgi:endonuclease YncB( thermonuclease family)